MKAEFASWPRGFADRIFRRPRLALPAIVAASAIAGPAFAEQCPPPIADALRLVMVTTPSMNTAQARLQLFARASPGQPWKSVGGAEPAVVGKAGLAWGYPFLRFRQHDELDKVEGDARTPAGFFRIGPSFGFAEAKLKGYILVKARETVCVENPASPLYNKITRRAAVDPAIRTDEMRATSLYRHGLFVDYPSDRATRRGSCIFIHIWQSPGKGTAGCIGLPAGRVMALQEFAEPGAVLGILPQTALARFSRCLPELR